MTNLKAAAIRLLFAWAFIISAHGATIIVTNTNDNGVGSLRRALALANDGDTIDATGISGVITLTSGELLVSQSVTINGPGADLLAVDGNAAGTVFAVMSMGPVTISDLTIRNANGRSGGGGFGGGIFNGGVGPLTIINSALSGNTAAFGGGAYNGGTLNIVNSTISGNTATEGAGVYNPATLTIANSTFSDNAASQVAGGVFNIGTLVIANSTISNNTSMFLAGGVVNLNNFQIENTILNEGHASANIYNNSSGVVMSLGYNVSSDDAFGILTGPGDQIETNPMLGPLQNNGGHTLTHALLPGSPAINAGNPNFTPPPFFDQRGPHFPRVRNGRIDVGSFEVQAGATPTATATATATATFTPTSTPAATHTPTPTPAATATSTSTATPTATPTATATATSTPAPTPTATHTPAPSATATFTPTPTPTATHMPKPTVTPRPTPTLTPSPTATHTPTPTPVSTPAVTTNSATLIASFSAALNGTVNPHGSTTTVHFQYGTTTSYGHATASQTRIGNTSQNVSASVSGLSAGTTYHFRVVATNSHGTAFGADRTLTTRSATGPPVAVTNSATNVTSSAATLHGSVDPHGLTTTVHFEYGPTTSYGHTTPSQSKTGNTYQSVSANISGLSASPTFHFRIVATNSAGTTHGRDMTFTKP